MFLPSLRVVRTPLTNSPRPIWIPGADAMPTDRKIARCSRLRAAAAGAMSEDQRNCRSDGWQYGLVLQQVVCAFDYAMRGSSWMHVQGPPSAISHAPRTLQMS